eukprot:382849_1
MGNNFATTHSNDSMFKQTTQSTHIQRKECGICFVKLVSQMPRCMTCGIIGCRLCVKKTINTNTNSYTIICKICDAKNNTKTANYMGKNLMKIVKNHKHNGRELLVLGYIRVLWISHCLLYDFDYTSRFPSNDVIQYIIQWLYIHESFDKTRIDKTIKLTNANQCIKHTYVNDETVSHIFGTSSIRSPGYKTWKFQLLDFDTTHLNQANFVLGIVIANKMDKIGTFSVSMFNESDEFGYGTSKFCYEPLEINDVI